MDVYQSADALTNSNTTLWFQNQEMRMVNI